MTMPLHITRCVATPSEIAIYYSESVEPDTAEAPAHFEIHCPLETGTRLQFKRATYDAIAKATRIDPGQPLEPGHWLSVLVRRVRSASDKKEIANDGRDNLFATHVNGGGEDPVLGPGR